MRIRKALFFPALFGLAALTAPAWATCWVCDLNDQCYDLTGGFLHCAEVTSAGGNSCDLYGGQCGDTHGGYHDGGLAQRGFEGGVLTTCAFYRITGDMSESYVDGNMRVVEPAVASNRAIASAALGSLGITSGRFSLVGQVRLFGSMNASATIDAADLGTLKFELRDRQVSIVRTGTGILRQYSAEVPVNAFWVVAIQQSSEKYVLVFRQAEFEEGAQGRADMALAVSAARLEARTIPIVPESLSLTLEAGSRGATTATRPTWGAIKTIYR